MKSSGPLAAFISTSALFAICTIALSGCVSPQTRTPEIDSASALNEAKKQREMVLEDRVNTQKRLQAVASSILVSGAELCGEKIRPYYGVLFWNEDSFEKDWKSVAQSRFGLTGQLQVSMVDPGSVAESAGMKDGDIVVSVNGWQPPAGKEAPARLTEKLAEFAKYGEPANFVVSRSGQSHDITLVPVQACDFAVKLSPDNTKNAYADGKNIVIHKGMMDFFRTDEEIALVVSHELAHNAMTHIDAKKSNAIMGGVAGLLLDVAVAFGGVNTNGEFSKLGSSIGAGVYSVEFEQEADYVGLYFMAIANYKINEAPTFWRRMATADSRAISMKSSHPTTPERFLALESAVDEINQKIEQGLPLKPELKKASEAEQASTN